MAYSTAQKTEIDEMVRELGYRYLSDYLEARGVQRLNETIGREGDLTGAQSQVLNMLRRAVEQHRDGGEPRCTERQATYLLDLERQVASHAEYIFDNRSRLTPTTVRRLSRSQASALIDEYKVDLA